MSARGLDRAGAGVGWLGGGGVVPGPRDWSPSKSSGFSSECGAEPSRVWSSRLMLSPGLLLGGGSWEGAWEARASEPVHVAPAPDTRAGACLLRPRGQVGVQTWGLEAGADPAGQSSREWRWQIPGPRPAGSSEGAGCPAGQCQVGQYLGAGLNCGSAPREVWRVQSGWGVSLKRGEQAQLVFLVCSQGDR